MTLRRVVVVGGSLAGLRAAEALRGAGFDGSLVVVGAEEGPAYDRPPLSKQVLSGMWEPDQAGLPVPVDGLDLEFLLGAPAAALDGAGRTLEIEGGRRLDFDGLVIATGATPRQLPGTEGTAGVYTLRTLDDCLAIRADFDATPGRVVVVGGGFIGAEVAATCRLRGLDVTMVEAMPVPLGRVVGDEMGRLFADLHRENDVDVRLGVGVAGVDAGAGGRVERVRLADGSAVDADVVVVGIGVVPNTGWLAGSGLDVTDGVVCDETLLAAPGIVAAGDVARWPNRLFGMEMRVEHWDNALEQGAAAAARLLAAGDGEGPGAGEPFTPVPWFWSDQYARKIQLAGWPAGYDEVKVVDGDVAERRFVALYRRGDRVVAALGVSRPRPVAQWRQRIADRMSWTEALELTTAG